MQRGEILRDERLKHLEALKEQGVDPYPAQVTRDHTMAEALTRLGQSVAVAGRVLAIRSHGKAMFLDLADESGKIQIYVKADELGDRFAELQLLDEGDFVAVQGEIFTTKLGETTVHTRSFQILVKTLRPLPSLWHGLKDTEERFRKRYLDLLLNPEVRQFFDLRVKIMKALRRVMDSHGFTEVETPTLQPMYGGASARPFTTHYNAYNTDVFLKIAPELYLKRLLVGGYEKVYEMSRNFRNEGADPTHNPEFMELEFYAAYWDDERLMAFTEDLVIETLEMVRGKAEIELSGEIIPITRPFDRITFSELTGGTMNDEAFKVGVKKIRRPTFVLQTPRYLVPLAKGLNEQVARSFQFCLAGMELAKAFSELNDPFDQRRQFELQAEGRAKGDEEAQPLDEEFLEALEHGMPPAAGFGMGLERFIALVAGQESLRQTMYFPFMKPRPKAEAKPLHSSSISEERRGMKSRGPKSTKQSPAKKKKPSK
jgi:lysyl-tRNA synthetase class 2